MRAFVWNVEKERMKACVSVQERVTDVSVCVCVCVCASEGERCECV